MRLVGYIQTSIFRQSDSNSGCTKSSVLRLLFSRRGPKEINVEAGASPGSSKKMCPCPGKVPEHTEAALDLAQACRPHHSSAT